MKSANCIIVEEGLPPNFQAVPPLCRPLFAFLDNGSQKSLSRKAFLDKPRPAGRPASGRLSRTDVGGALVVSGAKKRSI